MSERSILRSAPWSGGLLKPDRFPPPMPRPIAPLDLMAPAAPQRPARPGTSIQTSAKAAAALLVGGLLGLGTSAWLLEHRIDIAAVRAGPWVIWPKAGTVDIDPYARAIYAQSGQIAMTSAEGVLLTAEMDDSGVPLSGNCSYQVTGGLPPARFWSLGATTPAGLAVENPAGRNAFTSAEVLRRDDGNFAIEVAPSVRPGNWLPVPAKDRFVLALHLYDSPLGYTSAQLERSAVPAIHKEVCAP